MSKAKTGDNVSVHYTGKLKDGKVFDTSKERGPLDFEIGGNAVIEGFETGVVGMEPGESKVIEIPSDKAYGPWREEMTIQVEKDKLPPDLNPEIGQTLQVPQQNNPQPLLVTVVKVDETSITLDANHPLAGEDLIFEVELVEIK